MTSENLKQLFPNCSPAFIRRNARDARRTDLQPDRTGPAEQLERDTRHGDVGEVQAQAAFGRRFLVRLTSFRKRLLDEDNLCCKYLVDLCRYAGALSSDAPGTAKIEVTQEKVGSKEPERTVIEIFRIG